MNKLYSVHDHWTNINKKNDVDIESIDGVITGIKVNGEDYGGGTSWTEVFSGDVVTSGEAAPFSGTINAVLSGADTIKVFYNDGVHILPKQVTDDGIFYGAPAPENPSNIDFSEIPFLIKLGEVSTALYTQSPGPQDITILEPQSGGGSSDFSTAEVTFICTDNPEILLQFINNQDDGIYNVINITQPTQIVTVPLYKNKLSCNIAPFSMSVTSTSGNITGSQMDGYIITGNCTINYTLPM